MHARPAPAVVLSSRTVGVRGNPDADKIGTSYVERQNLTMRMGMRRFARLTNGSKKIENHAAAIALHYVYVNFRAASRGACSSVSPDSRDGRRTG